MALFVVLPFVGGWIGYTFAPEKVVEVNSVNSTNYTDDQIDHIKQLLIEEGVVYAKEDYFSELRKLREEYIIVDKNDDIMSFFDYENGRYVAKIGKKETEDLGRYIEIDTNGVTESGDYVSFKTFDGVSPGYGKISPNEKYLAYVDVSENGAVLIVYDLPGGKIVWSQRYDSIDPIICENERYAQVAVAWQDDETLLLYEDNVDFIDVHNGEVDYSLQGLGNPTASLDVVTQEMSNENSGVKYFSGIVYSDIGSEFDIAMFNSNFDDGQNSELDTEKPVHVVVRDKQGQVTDFSYSSEDLVEADVSGEFFYTMDNAIFNHYLTNSDRWAMYSTYYFGKDAPVSGAIVLGNHSNLVKGETVRIGDFEWLDGVRYRYKEYISCDEGEEAYLNDEGYIPCADRLMSHFNLSKEWTYGDISDLLKKLK